MFDISRYLHHNFDVFEGDRDYRIDCPFCPSEDTKRHMYIGISKEVVHCFRCGYKRSWIGFVMDFSGIPYHRALGELYVTPKVRDFGNLGEHVQDDTSSTSSHKNAKLPKGFENIWDSDLPLAAMAIKYLAKRGFDRHHIQRYNLGVSPELPFRIVIPIEGEYWQARAINNLVSPKYMNPDVPHKEAIFNSWALGVYNEIVVCEGAFSAMSVGDNAIAIIGKEPNQAKVARLLESPAKNFILAVEPEARDVFGMLADKLYRNGKMVTMWVYKEGDPNEGVLCDIMDYNGLSKIAYKILYKI